MLLQLVTELISYYVSACKLCSNFILVSLAACPVRLHHIKKAMRKLQEECIKQESLLTVAFLLYFGTAKVQKVLRLHYMKHYL
jgi:hypothetical protein